MNSLTRVSRICVLALAVFVLASAPLSRAQGQPDVITNTTIFVNFGDIKGESQDETHTNWVEAIAYSDGFSHEPQAMARTGGRAPIDPIFFPVKIVKLIDASSPKLREASVKGTHIPQVEIQFLRDGFLYLSVKLEEVLVAEVTSSMELPGAFREVVLLDFGAVEMTYTKQKPDGTAGGTITFKWSLAKGAY